MATSSLDAKLNQYKPTDQDGFSSQELSRSYWLVTHKVFFRNLAIGLVLVMDLLLMAYVLYGFGTYLFVQRPAGNRALGVLAQRVGSDALAGGQPVSAQPLQFGTTTILDEGNQRFDFITEVENVNPAWSVLVTYTYDVGGATSTASRTKLLLPRERAYLTVLGEPREESSIADASLRIINEKWMRVNPHDVPDVAAFMQGHLAFTIDNEKFEKSPDGSFSGISFDIANTTPYNYWAVPIQVVLLNAGQIAGFEEVMVRELRTGQKRTVSINNFIQNLDSDEVRVLPSVDIFDPSVYMSE